MAPCSPLTHRGNFDTYWGATLIIGPKGEFCYVIAKNLLNIERLDRQRNFVHGVDRRFWQGQGTALVPITNAFELLHEPRAL